MLLEFYYVIHLKKKKERKKYIVDGKLPHSGTQKRIVYEIVGEKAMGQG